MYLFLISFFTTIEAGIISLLAGGIWIVYTVIAWRRRGSKEGSLRSILLAIALLCLCLIILKPQYPVERSAGSALVLTEAVSAIPDSVPVFALHSVQVPATIPKINDLAFIERNYPEIQTVYVAGYNLAPEQTAHIQRLQIVSVEEQSPAGFRWLNYTHRVKEGEDLIVSGSYTNGADDTLKLVLITAEGRQDSAWIPTGSRRFVLQTQPQVVGSFIGELHIIQGDSIRREPLPYQVAGRKPLHLLMLQAFPAFEMNYLKDWLARQGHCIQLRARISRDNYYSQRINVGAEAKDRLILSAENLAEADLVVTDPESLRQLTRSQVSVLQEAVEKGLGLVIMPDESWMRKPEVLGHRFTLKPSGVSQFLPVSGASETLAATKAGKLPVSFANDRLPVPIVRSDVGETLAAYLPAGRGRLGAQLAVATYPWILQGEEAVYSRFWTDIIQTISRRQLLPEVRLAEKPFLWQDVPAKLLVSDTLHRPVRIQYASGRQQVVQPGSELLEMVGAAYSLWPAESGWLEVRQEKDSSLLGSHYVLPAGAWADLKRANWWRQNRKILSARNTHTPQTFTDQQEVPLIWFFLPFVASAGLLWWREKGSKS